MIYQCITKYEFICKMNLSRTLRIEHYTLLLLIRVLFFIIYALLCRRSTVTVMLNQTRKKSQAASCYLAIVYNIDKEDFNNDEV